MIIIFKKIILNDLGLLKMSGGNPSKHPSQKLLGGAGRILAPEDNPDLS